MNICVLDGFTLNPGDLTWDKLQQLGRCEIYDRTSAEDLLARAAHAQVLLTNKIPLNRNAIFALPDLEYIGVLATGTNVVDLAAARERDIPVTNVPAYSTRSVAQATIALLLELTNRAVDVQLVVVLMDAALSDPVVWVPAGRDVRVACF